ncbi:cysteine hydrolase family protein [Candidatus Bipolaricaulota bacterium]
MKKTSNMLVLLSILVTLAVSSGVAHGCGTALLVMDMQNFVFNPLSPWYTETGEDLIPAIETLIELARAAGLPIIYVRDVSQDSPGLDPFFFAIVDELTPLEGDTVLAKMTPNAFLNDEVGAYLKEQHIRRLLISGLSSTGCVQATLFDGIREGYEMVVVSDAHSSGTNVLRTKERNNTWRSRGIDVEMMADIDWAAFHCGGGS